MRISHYLERVICGEDFSPQSWIVRGLLMPASWIYLLGLKIYISIYSLGIRKRCRLVVPVICVGNITFGGTGKTPFVQMLCRFLQKNGVKVVVLTRGYGRKSKGTLIVSDYERVLSNAAQAGDEPYLLAKSLRGVPVLVDKDRRRSGKWACRQFYPDVIVLDDGMQYWQLEKNITITLLDSLNPFGSGYVMPAGNLRESISALKRSDIVVFSHSDLATQKQLLKYAKIANKYVDYDSMFCSSHKPVYFTNASGKKLELDFVRGRNIAAFCGIGSPKSFFDTLTSLGANVRKKIVFSDHMVYTSEVLDAISNIGAGMTIVTTEKDFTKIEDMNIPNLYVLTIKLELEDIDRFEERLKQKIIG